MPLSSYVKTALIELGEKEPHLQESIAAILNKTSKTIVFDVDKIKSLRKDFLDLTRAVSKAQDFKEAERLMEALVIWRENFDHFTELLLKELDAKGLQGHASRIREDSWDLSITMGNPPLDRSKITSPHYSWGPDTVFQDFQNKMPSWFRKVRRHARDLWKRMETAVSRGIEIQVQLEEDYQMEMEGFQVMVQELDLSEKAKITQKILKERMGVLAPGLRAYKKRALQIFPVLVQKQVPIIIRMDGGLNELAVYKGSGTRRIEIMANKLDKDVKRFVHVMAHEMAHHIYQTQLSEQQTDFWYRIVKAHKTVINVDEVLSIWPVGMSRFDFDDLLMEENPELYIQLQSIFTDPHYQGQNPLYREEFVEFKESWGNDLLVNTGLPTGYSSKNSQEAFCEVIGTLVAYGPKALPDAGVQWIKKILPQIKISKINFKIQP